MSPDASLQPRKDLRNLAIIAHVDHGKTTLVDGLFRFTGAVQSHQAVADRVTVSYTHLTLPTILRV